MAIELHKILNVDLYDYLEALESDIRDFYLWGVHCFNGNIDTFAKKVPNNAEVVVEYNFYYEGYAVQAPIPINGLQKRIKNGYVEFIYQSGTALIRKEGLFIP